MINLLAFPSKFLEFEQLNIKNPDYTTKYFDNWKLYFRYEDIYV